MILCIVCILITFNIKAQPTIQLQPFAEELNLPLDIVNNGSDRLFVVEKNGVIKMVLPSGDVLSEDFLDITGRVDASRSEMGLLGLAFSPDYQTNGEFYLNYTNSRGVTVISRFTNLNGDPFKGDPDSEEIILQISQPFNNHNGGDLAFGPDGYLYIASGDGGSSGDPAANSQAGTSLLGKILRLDVEGQDTYTIPTDNPFIGNPNVLDEIWALGLRNPWRMSFDRLSGDFWIGDVGQGNWEEVDFQPADSPGGENYGWRCYEGNHEYNTAGCLPPENYKFPIHEYANNRLSNGCSVTGGYVYRGSEFPDLYGWYIYADYCSGRFWALSSEDSTNVMIGDYKNNQFVGFGEDDDGELYVAAIQDGIVFKVTTPCELSVDINSENQVCPDVDDGFAEVILSDTTVMARIEWSNGDTTARIDSLSPGSYFVTVTSPGCEIIERADIRESNLPNSCLVNANFPEPFCEGDTVLLRACDAPAGYTYEWSQFDAVIAETDMPEFEVTESGVYSVSFKGDCNLGSSQEVNITFIDVPPKLVITRSGDTLRVENAADDFAWFLNDTFLTLTIRPYIIIAGDGDYTVLGSNGNCQGPLSDIFTVMTTSTDEGEPRALTIYPNPAGEVINLTINSFSDGLLRLYNTSGTEILRRPIQPKMQLDVSGHPKGIYFIRLESGGEVVNQKIILSDR